MHALEVVIDISRYTTIPTWMYPFVGSFIVTVLLKRWGHQVTPEGQPAIDLFVDILTLVSAGSVVASIAATPLIASITAAINGWASSSTTIQGAVIAGWVFLLVVVILLGWVYTSKETVLVLIGFGVALQALALLAPWINLILGWWLNYPVRWIWNGIVGMIFFIPQLEVS